MYCNIEKILHKLIVEGLVPQNQSAFCGSYGRNIKLYFPGKNSKQTGVFVKCSQHNGVENEFLTLRLVADHLKNHVLKPLYFWYEEEFYISVYPLQRIRTINPGQLNQYVIFNQLMDVFNSLFSQKQAFQEKLNVSDKVLLSFYKRSKFNFFPSMKKYFLHSMQTVREKYGKINQHGDFAVNNIAVNLKDNLILLDWEDFGKINYPFFDLATLTFSNILFQNKVEDLGHDPNIILDIPRLNIITNVCRKWGMSINSFKNHFPFFMMLFIYLKQDYGYDNYIISKVDRFLNQVSVSKRWVSILNI